MTLPFRLAPWLGLLVSVAACSGGAPPAGGGETPGSAGEPIIGGKPSTASDDAVVLVENMVDLGGYECSGTLLAPNLVVTARHCVSPLVNDAAFACDASGNVAQGDATLGPDVTPSHIDVRVGATRPPDSTAPAAHGVRILHDDATVLCNHDIALVVLDKAIPGATIAPVRLDDTAAPGESLTTIGWGVTESTEIPATRMQRSGVKVLGVGPGSDATLQVEIGPHEFLVGESTCEGDSGGPAIDATTHALVGVLSRGGNGTMSTKIADSCTGVQTANFFTEPSAFKSLLLDAYAAAGANPWNEGDPGPAPIATDAGPPAVTGASSGGCAMGRGGRGGDGRGAWLVAALAIAWSAVRKRRR